MYFKDDMAGKSLAVYSVTLSKPLRAEPAEQQGGRPLEDIKNYP